MYIRQSELNITVNTSDNMIKEAEEQKQAALSGYDTDIIPTD